MDLAPPIDMQAMVSIIGDDELAQKKYLDLFVVHGGPIMDIIISAIEDGDGSTVFKQTHKLKSSAATVGATKLTELCSQLERLGKQEDAIEMKNLGQPMSDEFKRVSDYIGRMD